MDIATKAVATVAAVVSLAIGGTALANAADSTSATAAATTAAATATQATATTDARPAGGQRAGEEIVTGDLADKLTAAAKAKLDGATVDRVETDADGAAYEAHVTRSDGTQATVLFDKDGTVTSVEEGMGPGAGPAPTA